MSRDPYFLNTARIGFRCWSNDDLPLAMALWGDREVTRFIGGPFTREQVEERLSREIASMRTHRIQYWPLFLLVNGEFAGCGGLRPYNLSERFLELGVHLLPAFWRQGLAEEAARAAIAHAFTVLGANALFAGHHPKNQASRKLLEKLGFAFTHEEFYPPTGLQHPSYLLRRPNPVQAAPTSR
jgi:[ribosomal protein S5]-alanine N-acetyltransferase